MRDAAAKTAARKNRNNPVDDAGASTANVNQPQKWSDYTVGAVLWACGEGVLAGRVPGALVPPPT